MIRNHRPQIGKTWCQNTSSRPKDWLLNFQTHGDQQSRLTNRNNGEQSCGSLSAKNLRCKKSNVTGLQIRLGITERTTNYKPQHTWNLRSLQVFKSSYERQIDWMISLQKLTISTTLPQSFVANKRHVRLLWSVEVLALLYKSQQTSLYSN
jgi:hypothetical protein